MAKTPVTTLRLSPELLARVDAFAERLKAETGLEVTRTEALRVLVTTGLEVKEKQKSDY